MNGGLLDGDHARVHRTGDAIRFVQLPDETASLSHSRAIRNEQSENSSVLNEFLHDWDVERKDRTGRILFPSPPGCYLAKFFLMTIRTTTLFAFVRFDFLAFSLLAAWHQSSARITSGAS